VNPMAMTTDGIGGDGVGQDSLLMLGESEFGSSWMDLGAGVGDLVVSTEQKQTQNSGQPQQDHVTVASRPVLSNSEDTIHRNLEDSRERREAALLKVLALQELTSHDVRANRKSKSDGTLTPEAISLIELIPVQNHPLLGGGPQNVEEPKIKTPTWKPCLILVSTRIGIDKMNKIYIPHLQWLLANDCCVGIIGGKPQASLFFFGYQGKDVIYLDPHYVQDALKANSTVTPKMLETYSCRTPLKMPLMDIDPSLAVGLLFSTKEKFLQFTAQHKDFEKTGNPIMFEIGPVPCSKFAKI